MISAEAFILVGGASSRMGRDKARLEIDGQDFVERIARVLSGVTERVSTVGSRYENDLWKLPNVADKFEKWGALGGLHAALSACREEWGLVVACDLPFVTEGLFKRLAELSENYDAVVPVQVDGRLQPLCALYSAETCLTVAEEMISNGERRPRVLFEKLRTRFVSPEEWQDLHGSDLFFKNINTPEDYVVAIKEI